MSPEAIGRPIRILIADDEAPARIRLEDLLRHEGGVNLVGTAEDGLQAVDAIRRLSPDLVFLDVQMPGKTGVQVVEEIGVAHMPVTIFATAFNQYAIEAFDAAALDYLVKPYDDQRFEEAFRRARRRIALEGVDRLRSQLLSMLEGVPYTTPGMQPTGGDAVPATAVATPVRYLERIAVEDRGKVRPVPVDQIEFITADGPYAELHVGDRRYVIREPMQALEERLNPERFMRVHRSVIVRLDLVEMLHRAPGGDYEVQLKGGRRLRVSRSRRAMLERWLGVSP